jgi:hypothetical protein
LLTITSPCDNGTEFKGEFAVLCAQINTKIINGRAYHPQTQGSIEIANRTFKKKLRTWQAANGRQDWVVALPWLAIIINTTESDSLPRSQTPFSVWFGRKPHWIYEPRPPTPEPEIELDDNGISIEDPFEDNSNNSDVFKAPDVVLSEIEQQVAKNNERLHTFMAKKGQKTRSVVDFQEGWIVTLNPSKTTS